MKLFLTAVLSVFIMLAPAYGDDDKGPKGDKGDKGEKGDRGEKGAKGDKGDKGERGLKGDQGEPGNRGDRGPAGAMGPRGPMGPSGPRGLDGKSGPAGRDGHDGSPGVSGPQGPKGADGASGAVGPMGPVGPQGKPGTSRDFTSTPDFKDCTVIGEPFDVSTDTDGSVRFSFLGSKTTALHGYRCPLKAIGTVEIAITADHALTASGLIFGVLSADGAATGLIENFIAGKHEGGFLRLKPDGSIPIGNAVLAAYPETATVWFRIVGEPGKLTFLYSATGKHWSKVAESVALAGSPYFVVLGEDLNGQEPYSFAVRHMRRP